LRGAAGPGILQLSLAGNCSFQTCRSATRDRVKKQAWWRGDRRQRAGNGFIRGENSSVCGQAEELGAVLLSSAKHTELAALQGNGWLSNAIGNPLDTPLPAKPDLRTAPIESRPGLKILAACGGYSALTAARPINACLCRRRTANEIS